ncbi:MAG: transketolase [bacterium]
MGEIAQWNDTDRLAVDTIRILAAEIVEKANSGHPGMPMGFATPAHALFSRYLTFNPDNPFWPARDRFVLSCGHGSALLYSLLHLSGYDLPMEELQQFRQWSSKTPGHPEFGLTAGVETTTGPLGQGISNAVGMAMAQRYIRQQLGVADGGFDPLDHFVYVFASDGDLQEGVSGEASSLAGRQRLGRLVVLYDDNRISIDGSTDLAWSEDVEVRYTAYGWHVDRADGTDGEAILAAIERARDVIDRPSLIRVSTTIGFGAPHKQGTAGVHGSPLGAEELAATKAALGWNHEPFFIPQEVYSCYSEAADRGRAAHETWLQQLDKWLSKDSGRADLWDQLVHGHLPKDVFDSLPAWWGGEKISTRKAAGAVLNAIAAKTRMFVGGNADLAGSTSMTVKDGGSFLPETPGGRNFHFGIREHAMGAVSNGMALYAGLRPYTGTFFTFSDYMRPSIRLAAIMGIPVTFVFSHDSIGVGEDGPTHQPVEQLAALRAMPGLVVLRPGDGTETVEAFRNALQRSDGPTLILTTRQNLPVIDRERYAGAEGLHKGGYVLADCEGIPEVILIGTGSELQHALGAYEKLSAEGKKVRVVSLPSWELFLAQKASYRDEVLPPSVTARVSVEAGVRFGWERFIGSRGIAVGIDRYGASAPGEVLMEKLGFTVENVVATARKAMAG